MYAYIQKVMKGGRSIFHCGLPRVDLYSVGIGIRLDFENRERKRRKMKWFTIYSLALIDQNTIAADGRCRERRKAAAIIKFVK